MLVVLRVHSNLPPPLPVQKEDCCGIPDLRRSGESSLSHTLGLPASTEDSWKSVGTARSPGSYEWWQSLGGPSLGLQLYVVPLVDSYRNLKGKPLPSIQRETEVQRGAPRPLPVEEPELEPIKSISWWARETQ